MKIEHWVGIHFKIKHNMQSNILMGDNITPVCVPTWAQEAYGNSAHSAHFSHDPKNAKR